ncbi:MAG: GNAT family N-acetyltransferase, partial [Saprospiraceae bacterium]|nr:GNAT family N-acetyltransferase [Saprospiraceae bacterium]
MKTKCDVDIQGMKESDLDTAILMLKETVRKVNRSDYSQGEIALWLHRVNKDKWLHRINHDFFIKAVDANRMVGFASLKGGNYIDLLYVDADYQRQGIASQLLHSMIKKGVHDGKKVFQTHASKTA